MIRAGGPRRCSPRGKAVDLRNYGVSYPAAEPPTFGDARDSHDRGGARCRDGCGLEEAKALQPLPDGSPKIVATGGKEAQPLATQPAKQRQDLKV
jgi:hypothetical protein